MYALCLPHTFTTNLNESNENFRVKWNVKFFEALAMTWQKHRTRWNCVFFSSHIDAYLCVVALSPVQFTVCPLPFFVPHLSVSLEMWRFGTGRETFYGRTFNKIDYLNNNHLILSIGLNKTTRIVYVVLKCLAVYNGAIRIWIFVDVENGSITAVKINNTSTNAQHTHTNTEI